MSSYGGLWLTPGNVQEKSQNPFRNATGCPARPSGLVQVRRYQMWWFQKRAIFLSGWSDCSSSCGDEGVQRMEYECLPPTGELFYDCGMEPISVRKCQNQPACIEANQPTICTGGDDSPICKDTAMMRYCVIPDYRKKCCHSCGNHA